jgi:hypothetical protein
MHEEEKRLRNEFRTLMKRAQKTDDQEDRRFAMEFTGDELPAEVARRQTRLATTQPAKARLEANKREADRKRSRHEHDD